MASMVYQNAKQLMLTEAINFNTGTFAAALVNANYAATTTDLYFSTPSADLIVAGATVALSGVTAVAGTVSANTATFSAVASGTASQVVVYENTGTASTSPLVCLFAVTAQVANGGNITVEWNDTPTTGELFAL
jgi:hypothetical protein